jgi:nitrite reductase/ring-hydroxylating ferredoxin subunit
MTKRIPVAKLGEVPAGRTKTFRYGFQNGILYNDGGSLKAFVNACTHMGGTTELSGSVLRCCRHQAEFSPVTGERLSGQAPEGTKLTPIELAIDGDQVCAILELPPDPFSF